MMVFASLISRIFDPFIGLILLFGIAAVRSGVFGWDLLRLLGIIFMSIFVPPLILLFLSVKAKLLSNWDISDRKQRVWALAVFLLFLFVDYFIMSLFGTALMNTVFRFLLLIFLGFFLITLRTKISGHMLAATTVVCFLVYWYGWVVLPLVLFLPLIAWSRLVLKRHTWVEVIGGTLYPILFFSILRYLNIIL
jgi:membrane-associated phospholipid phosphatase